VIYLKRVILALVTACFLIVGCSGSAFADAPLPLMPDGSVAGGFLKVGGDVQAGSCKPGGTYFECYGVAGQFVTDPDTGIVDGLGDKAKAAGNDAANILANALMTLAQMSTSSTAAFADNVYGANADYQVDPSGNGSYQSGNWLGMFEPLWMNIAAGLKQGFTTPFAPIVGLIVLLSLLIGLVRGRVSGVLVTFILSFVAVGAISVGTNYPVVVGRAADKIIVETTSSFREAMTNTDNSSTPGYAMVGGIADRIIFDRWVAGTLGDSDSATAKKYGPILYKSQAMSWDEARQYRADPSGAGKAIVERKQKDWTAAKDALKDEDPIAYANLTGEQGAGNRIAQGFLMNVVWLTAMPMIFVSLILTALAFMLIRLLIVFLPVVGLIGAIPRFHGVLKSAAEMFAAAIVNAIIFGAVATLVAVVNTFIMSDSTGGDWGTRLLFSAVFTVLAWSATSPFRKLTRFVTNYDPLASARGVWTSILGILKNILAALVTGGAAGAVVAGAVKQDGSANGAGLDPHPAQQQPLSSPQPAQAYTRPDVNPPIDATLEPDPVTVYAAPAVANVVDVDFYETDSPEVHAEPTNVAIEAAPAPTSTTVVVPDDIVTPVDPENGTTYLIYDGGRYVMHNEAGDVVWDENDDKADADV
jgi:hypothetical protein